MEFAEKIRLAVPKDGVVASVGRRLAGFVVDASLNLAWAIPLARWMHSEGIVLPDWEKKLWFTLPMVVNWGLVVARGQSAGKWLVGTRIVDAGGQRVGLTRGVLAREIPRIGVDFLPLALPLLTLPIGLLHLADAIWLGRADRRSLHDLVAGTWVVEAPAGWRDAATWLARFG